MDYVAVINGAVAAINENRRADNPGESATILLRGARWCLPILRGLALLDLVAHF